MTKAPISLQDLRRRLYVKAKAEPAWRFWGLYVHVCKMETLREAYAMAKKNNGAPGIDGVTFEAIEEGGVERSSSRSGTNWSQHRIGPCGTGKKEIPEGRGQKSASFRIPAIRDRVVQGALKLILEPIFEADFQPGSFGYRPKRTAHEAVTGWPRRSSKTRRASSTLTCEPTSTTCGMTCCLRRWPTGPMTMRGLHLLKMMLKASGKKGVPQGGVISPVLSNLYLTEVDRMLERGQDHAAASTPTSNTHALRTTW